MHDGHGAAPAGGQFLVGDGRAERDDVDRDRAVGHYVRAGHRVREQIGGSLLRRVARGPVDDESGQRRRVAGGKDDIVQIEHGNLPGA